MNSSYKHIIITGASRGFGRDLALELAEPDTILHLVARSDMSDLASELESQGAVVHVWNRDLTDTTSLSGLMVHISEKVNPVQTGYLALVNNAGMIDPVGPAGKYDSSTYRQNLELNYVAPLMLTHAFLAEFQDLDCVKRVVAVSSGAANKPYFGWSHYCSAKAGVDMFVKVVGMEQTEQPYPVEIMGFNPGRIGTDMQEIIRATGEEDFPMAHDFIRAWKEGEIGDPREIAGRLARQLLSDTFLSGKVVSNKDI